MPSGIYKRTKKRGGWKIKDTSKMKGKVSPNQGFQKGHKNSEETRRKISESNKGRKVSEETRKKIGLANSISLKGNIPWNKGKKGVMPTPWNKGNKSEVNIEKRKIREKRYKELGYPAVWLRNTRAKRKLAQGLFTVKEWDLLKKQYNFTCPCCRLVEPQIKLSIDHIVPLSRGGSNYIENIQPLCYKCNNKKHTKTIKYEYTAI
jgi:5-methylcytosine-specific restriction endonuclease McrA